MKNMFVIPPFTYFEVTSYLITFFKNNPRFFYNYKNTPFYLHFKFFKSFT
jgi:hypothetical protein